MTEEAHEGIDADIARLRAGAAGLPPGSPQRWAAETDLAELLLIRATERAGTAPAELLALEARRIRSTLEQLRDRCPAGAAAYHWACLTAARAAQFEGELTGDPAVRDTAVRLYERALAPFDGPGVRSGPQEPPWWTPATVAEGRCELALELLRRSRGRPSAQRHDLDRAVALLTPLVDGRDAALLHDLPSALTCLGLALADRSGLLGPATPDGAADRDAAVEVLRTVCAAPGDAEPEARYRLAVLLFARHDDACVPDDARVPDDACAPDGARVPGSTRGTGPGPYGTGTNLHGTGDPVEALRLLEPMTGWADEIGGETTALSVLLARHLHDHHPGPDTERTLTEWYLRALDHPGTVPQEARAHRMDLALLLHDRAERHKSAPYSAFPAPAADIREAWLHFRLALDELDRAEQGAGPGHEAAYGTPEERAGERFPLLMAFVATSSMLPQADPTDADLDLIVRRGEELIGLVPPDDPDRGGVCIRLALALFERTRRRAGPHLTPLLLRAMTPQRTEPGIALAANVPGLRADNERAIELLRTGVGLHGYDDDLYEAAACALAVSLLIGYVVGLPARDTGRVREAVRWFRIVFDRAPAGSELRSEDFEDLFIGALANSIWTSAPFTAEPPAGAGPPQVPDISRHPSVEDDVQTLHYLLRTVTGSRELPVPAYELLLLLVEYLRAPEQFDEATCRYWSDRLLGASEHADADEAPLKGFLLLAAGALGAGPGGRADAGPAEVAASEALLRAGHAYMPPDSDLVASLGGPGPVDGTGLLRRLLGVVTGTGRVPAPRDGSTGGAAPGGSGDAERYGPPGAPERCESLERYDSADDIVSSAAAVLPGDGRPYPFTLPVGRVLEVVGADDAPASAAATAVRALALHRRWLHESETSDLEEAIALAERACTLAGEEPRALADRLALFLAGLLRDRYLLLGDLLDLSAARRITEGLRDRHDPRVPCPGLTVLLARAHHDDGALPAGLLRPEPEPRAEPERRSGPWPESGPGPRSESPPDGYSAELLAFAALLRLAAVRHHNGGTDGEEETRRIGRLLAEAAGALPGTHPLRPATTAEEAQLRAARAAAAGRTEDLRAALDDILRAAESCPPGSAHRAPLLLRAAGVLSAHAELLDLPEGGAAGRGHPPGAGERAPGPPGTAPPVAGPPGTAPRALSGLDRGIALLTRGLDEAGQSFHGARARCQYGLAHLLMVRHRLAHDPADLRRAVSLLQEARAAVNSRPGDPFTVLLARALAGALRARGPRDADHRTQSRAAGKSVLAAHGRAVLLQAGTEAALTSARAVGGDMMRLVRWCLEDGRVEEAVDALELGRGLVLNAATVAATVPELLEQEGREDLAGEWRRHHPTGGAAPAGAASAALPDSLRRRVLQALEGGPAEQQLLSAPAPAETGQALRALGYDALVYLVPGRNGGGDALVVTSGGEVEQVPLPGLCTDPGGAAASYAEALGRFSAAARDPAEVPAEDAPAVMWELYRRSREQAGAASTAWRRALDPVRAWAGEVAMTSVIGKVLPAGPDRPPRLVLSPVGLLGPVPWHAALVPDGADGAVPACARAVISYCSTARRLNEVATRPRLPLEDAQLVVADPGGTRAMHDEARLIARLYPAATVLGLPPDGTGGPPPPEHAVTAARVAARLPGGEGPNAAVCHVNCHAAARATPALSSLELHPAATPPERLTVAEIQRTAQGRDPRAPGGLLVLANCTSDLTLDDHDEALTLATAFLGAGAASVVGSLWAVSDDSRTSMVMYMFHHYVSGRGRDVCPEAAGSPADALRAAQLWMTDPHRVVPADLAPLLRGRAQLPLDEAYIWAAFTHHGH
ncbi:CHAT domain-containing protein [Streptomyces sp. NPDC005805]|uniref:CHAT domain-containing protein n=1 Tax=Streptomyces sp. NPDC005805 TaxID=3157068 RepID=UPI0033C4657D